MMESVMNETEVLYDTLLWNWCPCCHKKPDDICIFSNLDEEEAQ